MEDQHATNNELSDNQSPANPSLQITEPIRSAWREMSGWFVFLGITLGVICLIMMYLMLGLLAAAVEYQRFGTILLFDFFGIGIAAAIFYLIISSQLRRGLEREENELLEKGFGNFSRLYRFTNIVSVVALISFLLLVILLIVNMGPLFKNFANMGRDF